MKYIEGCNLADHFDHRRPTPREAAALVAEIARALAAAHSRAVIHRDMKPQNIVVGRDGQRRVIDFGLAWLRGAWQPEASQTGTLSGTPGYMAPEQARGEKVDARSDVFGLGGVLYFLLTGQAPFAGKSPLETIERAKKCDFDREALKRERIPRGLRRICLKAIAAEPRDRYQTAEAMAKALERWLAVPQRILWLGAAGRSYELPLEVVSGPTPDEPFATLVHPSAEEAPVLEAPAGTEVVFVCASDQGPPTKEQVAAVPGRIKPWPQLPDGVVVEFDGKGVRPPGEPTLRGLGEKRRPRPLDNDWLQRADCLRRALASRFPLVCGVAFPHVDPAEPLPRSAHSMPARVRRFVGIGS